MFKYVYIICILLENMIVSFFFVEKIFFIIIFVEIVGIIFEDFIKEFFGGESLYIKFRKRM